MGIWKYWKALVGILHRLTLFSGLQPPELHMESQFCVILLPALPSFLPPLECELHIVIELAKRLKEIYG